MSTGFDTEQNSGTLAQPRFVLAAIGVALIVVAGAVVAVIGSSDSASPTPDPTPTVAEPSTTTTPSDTASTGDSVCGLEDGPQDVPVAPPEGTEWELVGTVAAPTAPDTIGPGEVDDGLRSCFARSPLGALYAAGNVIATTTDSEHVLRMVEELGADGEGRDAALVELRANPPSAPTRGALQIAGFSFLNYSEDEAVVDLALRSSTGAFGHAPVTMNWESGDWKVVFPRDGNIAGLTDPLPDLTGYVPWGGA